MKEEKIYDQKEVLKNINIFTDRKKELLIQSKELNKTLLRVRKQKEYWESLDFSQLKLL